VWLDNASGVVRKWSNDTETSLSLDCSAADTRPQVGSAGGSFVEQRQRLRISWGWDGRGDATEIEFVLCVELEG
jgi:hypothetical protein